MSDRTSENSAMFFIGCDLGIVTSARQKKNTVYTSGKSDIAPAAPPLLMLESESFSFLGHCAQ